MLMHEFDRRFATKDESFLFDILRRVGRLDRQAMIAATQDNWAVWQDGSPDPTDPGDGSGMRLARA